MTDNIYMKIAPFDSLVWGSLRLAPTRNWAKSRGWALYREWALFRETTKIRWSEIALRLLWDRSSTVATTCLRAEYCIQFLPAHAWITGP